MITATDLPQAPIESRHLFAPRYKNFIKMKQFALSVLCGSLAILSAVDVQAHDQIPGAPQTRPILIRGATIHPVSGAPIEGASLLFEHGRITDIGTDLDLPEQGLEIDATGKHIYPGMIESMTDLGLREIGAVDVTMDSRETGSVNPNVRAWVAFNPDSELIPVARANGILTALVAPSGSGIYGQAAVMELDGWTAADMSLLAPAGLCINWESFESRGEDAKQRAASRETRLSQLDDLLDSAERYAAAREANSERTATNVRLESMLPVIHGEVPVLAMANREGAIASAVMYAAQRGLKLIIVGGYDAERCANLLKKYDVPVIITATYRLPRYRHDPYDASYTLPARLAAAGVKFAICGDGGDSSNARNLPYQAANAVAYGLAEADAVRAVTLSAAEILGVADQIGSLEVDKLATLVITDGPLLESDTQIEHAYVAGRKVDLSSRHTLLNDKYRVKYQQRAVEQRLRQSGR